MKLLLVLALCLSAPALAEEAAPDNGCTDIKELLRSKCVSPRAAAMQGEKTSGQCDLFAKKVARIDKRVESVKAECNRASTVATKKSAKNGRSEQEGADKDTSAMAAQNGGYMKRCGTEMGKLRDSYKDLSSTSENEAAAAKGLPAECETAVKAAYAKMKQHADQKTTSAQGLADQYSRGGSAAEAVAGANQKNANALNSAGSPQQQGEGEKKQSAGGGGGGMPQIPQIPQMPQTPQQKPDPNAKTSAQLQAEQQAARQKECRGLINTYTSGVTSCDTLHRCQPEIVRVVDACNAYNSCIAALPVVPSDCSGAPSRAVAK